MFIMSIGMKEKSIYRLSNQPEDEERNEEGEKTTANFALRRLENFFFSSSIHPLVILSLSLHPHPSSTLNP